MGNPVPSLSTNGFITKPAEKLDLLLTHFVYAMKSQTSLYGASVASLPYILQQNATNIAAASSAIERVLLGYLARYFDSAEVQTSYTDDNPLKPGSAMRIKLAITVTDNGVSYNAAPILQVVDGKFKEFISINNQD